MFHQLQNQPKAELKIRNKYDHIVSRPPQEELARYRVLVNQLEREKKELLTAASYPVAIRKPNAL